MRTASDSLYDDLQQFGTSRGTRSRFSNTVRRAGSLETCGFKQRFWSLLGLRPKVSRASEGGSPPRPCGSGGRVPVPRRGRRSRRPHFFQQRKKWGKERRQKPMVFGIPFVRLQLRCKRVPQRIASAPTLAAADMARREQWSPSRLGDYRIAHLPPAAASVGAARWAAGI